MRIVDPEGREAALAALVQDHPGAVVAAINGDGLFVELPASIVLQGQQIVQARTALDLVVAEHRSRIIDAWEEAKVRGLSVTDVELVTRVEATCHFVDVRHVHGVLVGVFVAGADVELGSALGEREPVMPKTGRTEKDSTAFIRAADERICQILGWAHDELVGQRSLDLVHPEDRDAAIDAWLEMLSSPGGVSRVRLRHLRKDGSWLWMELTNTNRLDDDEGRVVTEMIDISDEMAAIEALRQREELLRRLAEALPSGVLHLDLDRKVVYANPRLVELLGAELLGNVHPEDATALHRALDGVLRAGLATALEVRVQLPGARRERLCEITGRALLDAAGDPEGAVLCFEDVTEAAELRAELERRATIDELTGCLNRSAVLAALESMLATASVGTAVVFLDLDGFKEVNDTFGHEAGDRLLASAAQRLRDGMRAGDVIGRLGGDEFVVVLRDVVDTDEAMVVASRLAAKLAEPVEVVRGLPTRIRSSIGVAWSDRVGVADTLIAAADRAMYESKRAGACEPVYAA